MFVTVMALKLHFVDISDHTDIFLNQLIRFYLNNTIIFAFQVNALYRVIHTKWRSYRDHGFRDFISPDVCASRAAEAIQTACIVQQSVTSQTNDDAVISPHRVRERVTCDGMCWKVDWLGEERRNSTAPCGPCVVAVRTGCIRRRWRRAVVVSISYHIRNL